MKKQSFLGKLAKDGSLKLVEPSNEISKSYIEKSNNSLRSAKILVKNNLFEDSVSMSYYSMYNCLLALFFKIGVKSENHSGSILLFKKLFRRNELFKILSFAKEERIDKQYYVTPKKKDLTKKPTIEMIRYAEKITIELKLIMEKLNNEKIGKLREKFKKIIS